jgi:anti-sigma regulatory factor (Ser/Thr protein kinase)
VQDMPTPSTVGERTIELPATAAAAGLARRELTSMPGISGELGYKALLLASELVSACVQDIEPGSQPTIWLALRVTETHVRVEVAGQRPQPVSQAMASRETPALGGMGLHIVERLSDRWGAEGPRGSTIWFELER